MQISSVFRNWYEPHCIEADGGEHHTLVVSAAEQLLFYCWKPGVAVPARASCMLPSPIFAPYLLRLVLVRSEN